MTALACSTRPAPCRIREWYLNTLKFADGPTRAYHDRTFGAHVADEDFQPTFERESRRWVADEWARLFEPAGAGYVVLTAKHTDGYLLWPSRETCRGRDQRLHWRRDGDDLIVQLPAPLPDRPAHVLRLSPLQ